jgi:hypothetical protein
MTARSLDLAAGLQSLFLAYRDISTGQLNVIKDLKRANRIIPFLEKLTFGTEGSFVAPQGGHDHVLAVSSRGNASLQFLYSNWLLTDRVMV